MKTICPPSEVSIGPQPTVLPARTGGGLSLRQLRPPAKDLTGTIFGRLTAAYPVYTNRGSSGWLCHCSCGKQITVKTSSLQNGNTRSCGCLKRDLRRKLNMKDLAGKTFGRLTVLGPTGKQGKHLHQLWDCLCSCGNRRVLGTSALTTGKTRSCGCMYRERRGPPARIKDLTGTKFGRLTPIAKYEIVDLRSNPSKWERRTHWTCLCDCGKQIVCCAKNLINGNTKSCDCLDRDTLLARNKTMVGDKHPHWDPTLTEEDRARNRLGCADQVSMQRINKQVRDRDGKVCFLCKERRGRLEVHHLEPWKTCRRLRFDPRNLITLCKTCHRDFHELHGFKESPGLEEFLKYMKGEDDD